MINAMENSDRAKLKMELEKAMNMYNRAIDSGKVVVTDERPKSKNALMNQL